MTDAVWADVVPRELTNVQCERMKNLTKNLGNAPLRFIPVTLVKADDEKAEMVQIRLSDCAKDYARKFCGGSVEDAIKHCMRFYDLAMKLGFEAEVKAKKKEKKKQNALINSIDSETTDIDELERLQKAQEYLEEIEMAIEHNKKEYWDLWNRLLGSDLQDKWNGLVVKYCDTVGYIDKGGIRVDDKKRGRGFDGFAATMRAWFLIVCEPNAAERHKLYLQTQVQMPKRGIKVVAFIERMKQLNEYTRFLPTQKDEEGAPEALPRGDVPFGDVQMCGIILLALPAGFQNAYWARKRGQFYPCDLDEFTEDLKAIEPEARQFSNLVDKVNGGLNDPIPRKKTTGGAGKDEHKKRKSAESSAAENKKEKGSDPKKKKTSRYCARCAEKSPKYKDTHDTVHCRLWNEDLSPKSKRAYAMSSDNSTAEMFAQLKLENQELRKSVKKLAKKDKKPSSKKASLRKLLRELDSSDSSDSDDE